jgi:flagellar hook-length control protein FliK
MSTTSADYLFQITPTGGSRASVPRPADRAAPFDEHLSQASTAPADTYRQPVTGSTESSTSTSQSHDSQTTAASGSAREKETRENRSSPGGEETASNAVKANEAENPPHDDGKSEGSEEAQDVQTEAGEVAAEAALAVAINQLPPTKDDTTAAELQSADEVPVESAATGSATQEKSKLQVKSGEQSTENAQPSANTRTFAAAAAIAVETSPQSESNASEVARRSADAERKGKRSGNNPEAVETEATTEVDVAASSDAEKKPDRDLAAKSSANSSKPEPLDDKLRQTADRGSQSGLSSEAVAKVVAVAAEAAASLTAANQELVSTSTADETAHASTSSASKGESLANLLARPQANASAQSAKAESGEELPRVDAGRFIGRVAKAFHAAQERDGTMQLRLSPPELGALRLELTVKDGVMTATMETETTAARRVLLDHLPVLRERLAEQNIRVERFDVDVRREGSGGQADGQTAQQQQQRDQHGGQSTPRRASAAPSRPMMAARQDVQSVANRISNSEINLVV